MDNKTSGVVGAHPVRVGEPFNPWRKACGFYPPDFVNKRTDMRDGEKRLYECLVRRAGRNGKCFPSCRRIAFDLGKSERQVRYDLQKLKTLGLIRWRRSEFRRSNIYEFLGHAMFTTTAADPERRETPQYARNRTVCRRVRHGMGCPPVVRRCF